MAGLFPQQFELLNEQSLALDRTASRLYVLLPSSKLFVIKSPLHNPSYSSISCTIPVPIATSHIALNRSNDLLLLASAKCLFVIQLPSQLPVNNAPILCPAWIVDHVCLASTSIVQVKWSLLSDVHLAVLASDSSLVMIDASVPSASETNSQYFVFEQQFTSFSFGSPFSSGWDMFAIFFYSVHGEIFVLCPVVPDGTFLSKDAINELKQLYMLEGSDRESQSFKRVISWFAYCWKEINHPKTKSSVMMKVGVSESWPLHPSLQGPFSPNADNSNTKYSQLICLPACSKVPILLRSTNGTIDILALFRPILPIFSQIRFNHTLASQSSFNHTLTLLDNIDFQHRGIFFLPLHDSFDSIFVHVPLQGVFELSFPWLSSMIRSFLSSSPDIDKVIASISSRSSFVSFTGKTQPFRSIGAVVMDYFDPIEGRHAFCLPNSVSSASDFESTCVHSLSLASSNKTLDFLEFLEFSPNETIPAFDADMNTFIESYREFSKWLKTIKRPKSDAPLDKELISALCSIRDKFVDMFNNAHSLDAALHDRMKLLHAQLADQTETIRSIEKLLEPLESLSSQYSLRLADAIQLHSLLSERALLLHHDSLLPTLTDEEKNFLDFVENAKSTVSNLKPLLKRATDRGERLIFPNSASKTIERPEAVIQSLSNQTQALELSLQTLSDLELTISQLSIQ